MISGEYAVLEGRRALVTAVSRRARLWVGANGSPALNSGSDLSRDRSGETPTSSPEAIHARQRGELRWFGSTSPFSDQALFLDVMALRQGDQKLGLGSSAAGAAASAAWFAAASGADLARESVRQAVLEDAFRGHHTVAPQGSGADVAASALGGIVSFKRLDGDVPYEASTLSLGDALTYRVVWTGKEARTSDFVAKVKTLKSSDTSTFERHIDAIDAASQAMAEAIEAQKADALVTATRAHHEAMAALGDAADAPIVEDALRGVAELAQSFGGAAKPSGAGGGDVALAFFSSARDADAFDQACHSSGLALVDLELGAEGVRVEPQQSPPT